MHLIATVRKREKVSLARFARKMRMSKREAKRLDDEFRDVPLSTVYRAAAALQVPITELLLGTHEFQSPFIRQRAGLVRAMKTVEALRVASTDEKTLRFAENLRNQLVAIMPELSEIKAWPQYGSIRGFDDMGRITTRIIPADLVPADEPY